MESSAMLVGLHQLLASEDLGQNIWIYPREIHIIAVKWLCLHNRQMQLETLMCLMSRCAPVCDGKCWGLEWNVFIR